MSTRAAAAANSRRVKQRLVKILFGSKYSMGGRDSHRQLDSASYSYTDLRKAYIQKIQTLHPDRFNVNALNSKSHAVSENDDENSQEPPRTEFNSTWGENINWRSTAEAIGRKKVGHEAFVELQDAWAAYDNMAKKMKGKSDNIVVEDNFTMFGVGCSFSDNPSEQRMRAEIMDQACKGWFSSGQLGEQAIVHDSHEFDESSTSSLGRSHHDEINVPKDDWRYHASDVKINTSKDDQNMNAMDGNSCARKSLIDHMIPRHKR